MVEAALGDQFAGVFGGFDVTGLHGNLPDFFGVMLADGGRALKIKQAAARVRKEIDPNQCRLKTGVTA
ncbi:MAG: hypothetical protein VW338_09970 [Rhodospirillaceae bacterium]